MQFSNAVTPSLSVSVGMVHTTAVELFRMLSTCFKGPILLMSSLAAPIFFSYVLVIPLPSYTLFFLAMTDIEEAPLIGLDVRSTIHQLLRKHTKSIIKKAA